MKYTITGADKDSGENIELTVEAIDEGAARELAHRKNILVSTIASSRTGMTSVASSPAPLHMPPPLRPRLEQGHVRGAPIVNIAQPRRGSSLGVAAVVLGVLSFVICWIPIVNLAAIVLGGLGLILGVVGVLVSFTRRGSGIGLGIAGSAVCGVALFVAIGMNVAIMQGLSNANQAVNPASSGTANVWGSVPDIAEHPSASNAADPTASSTAQPVPAVPSIEWTQTGTPARLGEVEVSVASTRIGQLGVREYREMRTTRDALFQIRIQIANRSETRKIEYTTWRGRSSFSRQVGILTDNFGNSYKRIEFGIGVEVEGGLNSESLYPGNVVYDILVFELPVAKAEYLNLELPAEAFGETGKLRFRIPTKEIEK